MRDSEMTTVRSARESIQWAGVTEFVHRMAAALRLPWKVRTDRPWVALVAVPLAMNATGLTEQWWLWIPLVIGSAACTPTWRWTWVLSLQLGLLGTEWAYVGAVSLAMWPMHRTFVGIIWIACVLALAAVGGFNRRYQSLPERRIRL